MANVSFVELQNQVARKLGILPAGQDIGADDGQIIGDALLSVQEQLSQLRVAYFDLKNGVELAYSEPLAMMGAAATVDEFEVPEPKRSQLIAQGVIGMPGRSLAERRVRDLVEVPTNKLHTATDVPAI